MAESIQTASLSGDFAYKTQSLAESVQWSLSLCSKAEQRFLYTVAYLADGFTETCANRVRASIMDDDGGTIRSVTHLCDASLLQAIPHGRYRMIEFVRANIERMADASGYEHLERCIDALTEEITLLGCDGVCDPSYEDLIALERERGNVRRLVARALSGSNSMLNTKGLILLAEYMPALCRIEMPQYVVETCEAYLDKSHLLPLPLACRLVRFIAGAKWGVGHWNDAANLIHTLIECHRTAFRTKATTSVEWEGDRSYDLALILADRVRLGCLASNQGSSASRQMTYEELMAMISVAGELSKRVRPFPVTDQVNRKREACIRAILASRRAQVLDSYGEQSSAAEVVESIVADRPNWSMLSTQQQGELKNRLGLAYWHGGQLDRAEECFSQAASLFSKAGDTMWQGGALANLGTRIK